MEILIVSLPDLKKINLQRPHHLLRHLVKNNNVSIISANAWWLDEIDDSLLNECFQDVHYDYLSTKRTNPLIQEFLIKDKIRLMRKESANYDICINFHSLLAGQILSKHLDLPIVLDICDDVVDWIANSPKVPSITRPLARSLAGALLRRNINTASRITYSIETLKQKYQFPDNKSCLIPNGVDTELFQNKGKHIRKQLKLLNTDIIFGFVGFLGPWVNFDPVFKAIAELKKHFNVSMVIVGDGPSLGHWMKRVKDLSLSDDIVFTGNVQYRDVPDYISSMDICLLPFDMSMVSQNALPLKLFEYMACQVPVISTPISGVRNAVGDRVYYYSNASELQDIVTRITQEDAHHELLVGEGRQYVQKHFSWNKICSDFERVLNEAVEE